MAGSVPVNNAIFIILHLQLFFYPVKINQALFIVKKNMPFFITFFLSLAIHVSGQKVNDLEVKITTWYQNKPGAVSISFDDVSYTQYSYGYPILEKYKIKGTFSIVGEWVGEQPDYFAEPDNFEIQKMGWPQLMELFNHGHELAAHGFLHVRYDKHLPVSDLAFEMKKIKTLIESRTNSRVFTLNYPYSFASGNIPDAAREAGYLFGRTGLDTINSPTPYNMNLLATQVILNSEQPDSLMFQNWLKQAKGNWLILMYHHLFPLKSKEMELIRLHDVEYSYSVLPEEFEAHIEAMVAAGYWIAPISEVGRYIIQRENTEFRTILCRNQIFIYSVTNLNKQIYNQPLTLEIKVPWKKVRIEGSLDDGVFETQNNKLFINVFPENQLILSKE